MVARSSARQAGAATLVVVMVLFFVLTLAAAYASRNLIFEQRTAINLARSTGAQEAAEAGIEWAVTMLNSGRIDDNCLPTTDTTRNSFRQRYLNYDESGKLIPKFPTTGSNLVWAACVNDGTNWSCYCPSADGTLPATLPAGAAAFAVRFKGQIAAQSAAPLGLPMPKVGTIRIEVNGCTSSSMDCLTAVRPDLPYTKCESSVCAILSQYPSLKLIPTAAITAGGTVGGTLLEAYNTDPQTGVTIHANDFTVATPQLGGPPGVPGVSTLIAPDPKLGSLESYSATCNLCMFSSVFGLQPETYKQQQAVVKADCGSSGCTSLSSVITPALAASRGTSDAVDMSSGALTARGSTVWVAGTGGLTLGAPATIGSPDAPVVLILEGPLTISNDVRIYGVVFAPSAALNYGPGSATASAATSATIQGALVTTGDVTAGGPAANPGRVIYDPDIVAKVAKFNGNFVRVPGTWRDFP